MPDFPRWSSLALEATATFFLVLVVFATMVDENSSFRSLGAFGMGLMYTVGILIAGPFTGGALNPARAFGPAFASNHWLNQGVYWIGPLIGGFLAGLLYDSLFLRKSDL
jgi:glycerol uptake facilitator-like aquaporin